MGKDEMELELSLYLERALSIINNLSANYFGCSKEQEENNNGMYLLADYDDARISVDIAQDYLYRANKVMGEMEKQSELKCF